MSKHEILHERSNKSKFECDLCGNKSYPEKNSLNFHSHVVHNRSKSYRCSECSYSAIDRRYLVRNVRSRHTEQTESGNEYRASLTKRRKALDRASRCQICDVGKDRSSECSRVHHYVPFVLLQRIMLEIV